MKTQVHCCAPCAIKNPVAFLVPSFLQFFFSSINSSPVNGQVYTHYFLWIRIIVSFLHTRHYISMLLDGGSWEIHQCIVSIVPIFFLRIWIIVISNRSISLRLHATRVPLKDLVDLLDDEVYLIFQCPFCISSSNYVARKCIFKYCLKISETYILEFHENLSSKEFHILIQKFLNLCFLSADIYFWKRADMTLDAMVTIFFLASVSCILQIAGERHYLS